MLVCVCVCVYVCVCVRVCVTQTLLSLVAHSWLNPHKSLVPRARVLVYVMSLAWAGQMPTTVLSPSTCVFCARHSKHARLAYDQGWPEPYIYKPYITVYLVIFLPRIITFIHRMYLWFWPTLLMMYLMHVYDVYVPYL